MADQITTKDHIGYLVRRRFPLSYLLNIRPSSTGARPPDTTELRKEVDAFTAELKALSLEGLVARYDAEKSKELEQLRAKAEQEEAERYFNQPHARADYEHWSKAAHWTLDEAIALSFGKAPEVVRWDNFDFSTLSSPFRAQYARRRDLALRAKAWEQLFDPVLPGIFLAWAKRLDIPVPAELTDAVEKRGVQVADWKTRYDEAMDLLKREREFREKVVADWRGLYEKLKADFTESHAKWLALAERKNERIDTLEQTLALLERTPTEKSEQSPDIGLKTREKESLLKLVIGMAVKGYVYDPKAGRSSSIADIVKDLEKAGVPLDADTVRKWLREAAELLPPLNSGN